MTRRSSPVGPGALAVLAAALLAGGLAACSPRPSAAPCPDCLVLHDVTVIDGLGNPPAPHQTVVVRGGLIEGVYDAEGMPMWEDGHRWAAYVVDAPEGEAADSSRTLLYGAFLPMGRAEVAVTEPSVGEPPRVFVLSRSTARVTGEDIAYDGPGQARGLGGATFFPLRWVPAP